jgi:8-oxo-dGTP diphosphatase
VPADAAPAAGLAVDVAVFTVLDNELRVLVLNSAPSAGEEPTLPSGRADVDETPDEAAGRVARAATGRHAEDLYLHADRQVVSYLASSDEQLALTVVYIAVLSDAPPIEGATWTAVSDADTAIGSEHAVVLDPAIHQLCVLLERTAIALSFLPAIFTIAEMRHVYDAVWSVQLDPGNFSRNVRSREGFIVNTGFVRHDVPAGRPPCLYQRGSVPTLSPPLTRVGLLP